MKHALHIALFGMLILAFSRCDFPNDPPLLQPNPDKIDRSHLLPLSENYRYAYRSEPIVDEGGQLWTFHMQLVTAPNGTFYKIMYHYIDISGESPTRLILMPPALRNTPDGLEAYFIHPSEIDSVNLMYQPVLFWKFPYPAEIGDKWINNSAQTPYTIELVAKDTLVYSTDEVQTARCYAYNVYYTKFDPDELYYRVYFVPGEAIFKIEHMIERLVVTTYYWAWD
jgi:hypothetical protein